MTEATQQHPPPRLTASMCQPLHDIYFNGQQDAVNISADHVAFDIKVPDTLVVAYQEDLVTIQNPRLDCFETRVDRGDVEIKTKKKRPFVCLATGYCPDGRLVIDNDTSMTLILKDLRLTSKRGSAVYLRQRQKTVIELPEGSSSTLADAADYHPADSTDTSNGCLYARGTLSFAGGGSLQVTGNYRHAIFSGKNITIDGGLVQIADAMKDGIHCDKLHIQGGTIGLNISHDGAKGIKCKEELLITGGHVEGTATGNVTIAKGETTYCSLLKSDGSMTIKDGSMALKHYGTGGRCISVDKNMLIAGGTIDMECHGAGGSYLTTTNDSDYYTPKCITVDDSIHISDGTLSCISTGLGGKGIVAGRYLAIGNSDNENTPIIRVETKGECIINNVDEDLRFGCPKGIKANEKICIFGGDIAVTTAGMGGEGVESNKEMYIYGGTLVCNTYDDGINVVDSIEISGGHVYCNSVDNDGIDSNGSIRISGGIVASVNQNRPNESFDSEGGKFYLSGGWVFGIGSSPVEVQESTYPYYSTQYYDGTLHGGLIFSEEKYVCILIDGEVIMALKNGNRSLRAFLTICHPVFSEDKQYLICEGDLPTNVHHFYFDKKLVTGGVLNQYRPIISIQVQKK